MNKPPELWLSKTGAEVQGPDSGHSIARVDKPISSNRIDGWSNNSAVLSIRLSDSIGRPPAQAVRLHRLTTYIRCPLPQAGGFSRLADSAG
jgi:hypothetical protein